MIKKPKMPKSWTDRSAKTYNNSWYKWFYSLPEYQRDKVLKNGD